VFVGDERADSQKMPGSTRVFRITGYTENSATEIGKVGPIGERIMTPEAWAEAARLMNVFYTADPPESDGAYTQVMELTLAYLVHTIRSLRRGHNDADDLAREILSKVWLTKVEGARYNPTKPFHAWLSTVVRNHLRDIGRKIVVRKEGALPTDDVIPEPESDELEVCSSEWLGLFSDRHKQCREKLEAQDAHVYELHCQRDASNGDFLKMVAEPLELTYSAASGRVFKVREQIRACLKHHGFEIVSVGARHADAGVVCRFRDSKTHEFATMLIYTP
jgi:RNA polymerase sigma factor (sigma-70 family)